MQAPIPDLDPRAALAAAVNAVFRAQKSDDPILTELAGRHFEAIVNMLEIQWKPDCLADLSRTAATAPLENAA